MKGIKLSRYFEVVKPKYIYLKLTPNYSIRNNNTHKLARTISSLYKSMIYAIKREEMKLVKVLGREFIWGTKYSYQVSPKVSYYIYIEKQRVEFFFIIPEQHLSIIKEKISDIWPGVTVSKVDEIPLFNEEASKYQLVYKNEDALSLATDRRNNDLLNSNLNIIDVLEEGDKVGVFYNFMPTSQLTWESDFKGTIEKVKNKLPVERNKLNVLYGIKLAVSMLSSLTSSVSGLFKGPYSASLNMDSLVLALSTINKKEVSESTEKKGTSTVLKTQIILLSESKNRLRQVNNLRSLSNSFDTLSEDNQLKAKRYARKFSPLEYNLGAETNKVSVEECQNFISLAGRELLEQYNFIEKVSTQETEVPKELQEGTICIGSNTFRGQEQRAYLSTDPEYKQLTLVLIGPTRAGKTTLIGNIANDALNAGECNIIFDFCGNAELSKELAELFPPEKVLNIDCSNMDNLQGLGYNEVKKASNPYEQYRNAKSQTTQLLALINSINAADKELAPRMERYLVAASLITFVVNGSVKDVFDVLQNHNARANFISKIAVEHKENLEEYVMSLRELDEIDNKSNEAVTTKYHLISGIIDRLNKLKLNSYMELMLKKDCSKNIDLVNEIQKPQLICLRMPETMFSTDQERDIYCTYWMTKLWLALQIRKWEIQDRSQHTKVNIIIDELYQVEHTEQFLKEKLSRLAKFSAKPIISCHYLNQIKIIRDELRSANASYMLVAGSDKKNFDELKSELYPYTEEDLLNLPRYHSLNYIKYKDGYAKFITRLPKPIKRKD